MHHVYIIRSLKVVGKVYVGYTLNIQERLQTHNEGGSVYTADYKPWELVTSISFANKPQALAFEAYLKSHAGRAFMSKRLV